MTPQQAQFALRCAAAEWLAEHPDDPNAANVREALIETNPPIASYGEGYPVSYGGEGG